MKRETVQEAAQRVIALLQMHSGMKGCKVVSAYPFLDVSRPLDQPVVAVGLRGASASKNEGKAELGLWLYVPEREGGGALTGLFSTVCSSLLEADAGVAEIKVTKSVEYSGELYAFSLLCTVALPLRMTDQEEEASMLTGVEVRGDIH